jgi:hypothetical protein
MKEYKKFIKAYNDLERYNRQKKRSCFYPGCNNPTINSHAISQHVLSRIAEKGHVRMLRHHPYKSFEFASVGIREATIFSGFCAQHDTALFKDIDKPGDDLGAPRTVLLMNYRATVREQVTKLNRRETYAGSVDAADSINYPATDYYSSRVDEYAFNYMVSEWYSSELLKGRDTKTPGIEYSGFRLPYYELAASELISFEPDSITKLKRSLMTRCIPVFHPFSELYVHIVPLADKSATMLILSMHEKDRAILDYLTDYFQSISHEAMLTDILVLYLEGWACSEHFYQKFILPNQERIFGVIDATVLYSAPGRSTSLNLFEHIDVRQ